MRYQVLGPLEVSAGKRTIPIGGPKQRLVLANLVVRANEVVPADRLIDEVWADDVPDAVRVSLQSYVSNLRKALGPDRIERRPPGYVLHADPGEVDALRFSSLVQEGHRSLPDSPRAAAAVFDDALALWRGPPFADLRDEPSLRAEVAHLEELHLSAMEGRVDAGLALGRHPELVAELETLTAEHPLRERLWGQLMVALYRSDRQAEALEAYRRAQKILVDELGIDPSLELQRLEQQILRQDPSLDFHGEPLRGYQLIEPIGEGAFGVVYRASLPQVGREVAIKVIRPELANDPAFVRRFEAEGQLVARLDHPHIVPLYDYWRDPDAAYLVMRLVSGGSVRDRLRDGPLEPDQAARIVGQVGSALATAHRRGIVHRDVKPANVLLDDEGNAYLSDFGVARDVADIAGVARAATSDLVAYRSPEQIRGEPASPATDLYALGLVLFEMLGGRHPFPEPSPQALIEKQLSEPLPSIRTLRPDLAPGIDDVLAMATAKDPADRFPDPAAMTAELRKVLRPGPVQPPVAIVERNPYKGLLPFDEADARDFFGRRALVDRLVARLSEDVDGSRFLAVVGPSGSGKSSVVRAGLVPALRDGALPGSDAWFVVEMTPGAQPFEEVGAALRRIAVNDPERLLEQLESNEAGLAGAVERVLPADGSELLLVIDQFEEVFTLVDDEALRARFLASLITAVEDPRSRLLVVVTLRADFYDRPLGYQGFGDLLGSRTQTVTQLGSHELERVIAGPAEHVGASVERALLAEVAAEFADRPGALPMLEYALTESFECRRDGELTLEAYRSTGGMSGALARRADEIYEGLDATGRECVRQLFLRLVVVGEGSVETRRRVVRDDLASVEVDGRPIDSVVELLGSSRLLSFDRDPVTRGPTVEVAHEALLHAWGRLAGWVEQARGDLRIHRSLSAEAGEWVGSGCDASFLLRGSRLEQVETWASGSSLALTTAEHQYVEESLRQRDAERRAEETQQQREGALRRRSINRLRALVAALTVGAVAAASLAVVAAQQGNRAEREGRIAIARELAAAAVANLDVDPERSILLAIRAVEVSRSADGPVLPEAEEALHRAVTSSRLVRALPGGDAADWSPLGLVAAIDPEEASYVNISDEETGQVGLTISVSPAEITDVVFSPDGSTLATTSDDGRLILWDASTGAIIAESVAVGGASGPSFSADGSVLAAAWAERGVVKLLDPSTGTVTDVIRHLRRASETALDPHGRMIAVAIRGLCTGGRWTSFEVDLRTERRRPLDGADPCGADFVTWSPDGKYIAAPVGGPDAGVKIWDAATGTLRFHLVGHTDSVLSGDWSSDSSRFVTGSYDSTAKVWLITRGGARQLYSLSTQDNRNITDVAFSPGDTQVMTAYRVHGAAPRPFGVSQNAVMIWDVSDLSGAEVANLPSGCGGLARSDVAFIGDGDRFILADDRCRPAEWESNGRQVRTIGPSPVRARRWWDAPLFEASADGGTIAVAPGDQTLSVWDVASGHQRFSVREPQMRGYNLSASGEFVLIGDGQRVSIVDRTGQEVGSLAAPEGLGVSGAQMSPDDRLVALAIGQRVSIWDWERGALVATIPAETEFLAFDPTATLLATAGDDLTPEIWDVKSGELVTRLAPQPGDIYGLEFSPDGSHFAIGSADGSIRVVDTLSDEQLVLPGRGSGVQDIAFSRDGSMLASTSGGIARVWALNVDDLLQIARQKLTRSWTPEECRIYLHLSTCPA
jgi:serine/threonine protein kinase/WD40 repeat protein/DNA-binding SARP family transcriptional activator